MNGRRALVVDDEVALRQLLQRLLVSRGFVVDLAEDGQAACHQLQRQCYDAIFSDFQMPNMSGMALLDWTRENHPELASTFVFVMGGLITAELQAAIKRDRIPVLLKPFGAAALDAVLGELFTEPLSAFIPEAKAQ
jgi:CheY-like chemotaxis protein